MQLVIAGDGPSRAEVAAAAERANAAAGRRAVVLTGELQDPRPAYAAADVCLGMGGSALRAMAFGRPLVVQGEHGFWELLTPDSVERFLWTGWYGVGRRAPSTAPRGSSSSCAGCWPTAAAARAWARYARRLVEDRFSLQSAAARQLELYERALGEARSPRALARARRRLGLQAGARTASRAASTRCAAG